MNHVEQHPGSPHARPGNALEVVLVGMMPGGVHPGLKAALKTKLTWLSPSLSSLCSLVLNDPWAVGELRAPRRPRRVTFCRETSPGFDRAKLTSSASRVRFCVRGAPSLVPYGGERRDHLVDASLFCGVVVGFTPRHGPAGDGGGGTALEAFADRASGVDDLPCGDVLGRVGAPVAESSIFQV